MFPNKVRFYRYLKMLIECANDNSTGKLYAVIEKPHEYYFEGGHNLCFYDGQHIYPKIVLEFKDDGEKLFRAQECNNKPLPDFINDIIKEKILKWNFWTLFE